MELITMMKQLAIFVLLVGACFASATLWPTTNGINATITADLYGNKVIEINNANNATILCHRESMDSATSFSAADEFSWGDKMTVANGTTLVLLTEPGPNSVYCTNVAKTARLTPSSNMVGYPQNPFMLLAVAAMTLYTLSQMFKRKDWIIAIGISVGALLLTMLTMPESPLLNIIIWLPALTMLDMIYVFLLGKLQNSNLGRKFFGGKS